MVQLTGEQAGDVQHTACSLPSGLQVQVVERHKHVQADHRQQAENQYRLWFVLINVICMPTGAQLIETFIFDLPAQMSKVIESRCSCHLSTFLA